MILIVIRAIRVLFFSNYAIMQSNYAKKEIRTRNSNTRIKKRYIWEKTKKMDNEIDDMITDEQHMTKTLPGKNVLETNSKLNSI